MAITPSPPHPFGPLFKLPQGFFDDLLTYHAEWTRKYRSQLVESSGNKAADALPRSPVYEGGRTESPDIQGGKMAHRKEEPAHDPVRHPKHYTQGIECWDFILSHGLGFLEGNIIKYVVRFKLKNGLQDLLKAQAYLEKLIKETKEELERSST